jgi:hypothetical protein
LASDAIEGSVVSVVVVVAVAADGVLPTGEEFGGLGRPIGLYGIIGIGTGAGTVLTAPQPCCWPGAAAASRRVEGEPTGFGWA